MSRAPKALVKALRGERDRLEMEGLKNRRMIVSLDRLLSRPDYAVEREVNYSHVEAEAWLHYQGPVGTLHGQPVRYCFTHMMWEPAT